MCNMCYSSIRMRQMLLAAALAAMQMPSTSPPLRQIGSIDLPHVDGRIDHLAVDTVRQRLYVAALGHNTVEVLDLAAGTHLKSLPGFHEPQGIAVVSTRNVVAVANGQAEGLQLLSAEDFRPGQTVKVGEDPDNVRFDAASRR